MTEIPSAGPNLSNEFDNEFNAEAVAPLARCAKLVLRFASARATRYVLSRSTSRPPFFSFTRDRRGPTTRPKNDENETDGKSREISIAETSPLTPRVSNQSRSLRLEVSHVDSLSIRLQTTGISTICSRHSSILPSCTAFDLDLARANERRNDRRGCFRFSVDVSKTLRLVSFEIAFQIGNTRHRILFPVHRSRDQFFFSFYFSRLWNRARKERNRGGLNGSLLNISGMEPVWGRKGYFRARESMERVTREKG